MCDHHRMIAGQQSLFEPVAIAAFALVRVLHVPLQQQHVGLRNIRTTSMVVVMIDSAAASAAAETMVVGQHQSSAATRQGRDG